MKIHIDHNNINALCGNPQNDHVVCGGNGLWKIDIEDYSVNQVDKKKVDNIDILNQMVVTTGHIVNLWDLHTWQLLKTYHVNHQGINDHINDIKFINSVCFVTGGNNCNVTVFDINHTNSIYDLKVSTDNISCIQTDDNKVYVSSYDGRLSIIDLRMEKRRQYQFHSVLVKFKLYKQFLVSVTDHGEILIFDTDTTKILNQYKFMKNLKYVIDLDVVHSHKTYIYIGTQDAKIVKIEWDTLKHLLVNKQFQHLDLEIICNVISKNEKIISTSNDGFVYIFENF